MRKLILLSALVLLIPTLISAASIEIKVFLQGPYIGNGKMQSGISQEILLANLPEGLEVSSIPIGAIDLIQVQLYSAGHSIAAHSAYAWLMADGNLQDVSTSVRGVEFPGVTGTFQLVVLHRNHLPLVAASSVTLSDVNLTLDLSKKGNVSNATAVVSLDGDVIGMAAGNLVNETAGVWEINAADLGQFVFMAQRSLSGFSNADLNFDGSVNQKDRSILEQNNDNLLRTSLSNQ
jgi:hypothetical protein